MQWLKALRLPMCFMTVLLVALVFKEGRGNISWSIAIGCGFGVAATMLQNDWRDRFHDRKKNKNFVLNNLPTFLFLVVMVWIIVFGFAVSAFYQGLYSGVIFVLLGGISFLYSEARKIPMAPAILVGAASMLLVLLPCQELSPQMRVVFYLFALSTFFVITGREVMKDIDDVLIDQGYKWTLPVKMGVQKAKLVAIGFIMTGSIVACISFSMASRNFPIAGVLVILAGLSFFGLGMPSKAARGWIDAGMAVSLLSMFVF
jgi:4-hydroxybenzoate polyprenyltransferase